MPQAGVKVWLLPCVQEHVNPRDSRDKNALVDSMLLVQPGSALVLNTAMYVRVATEKSQMLALIPLVKLHMSAGGIRIAKVTGVKQVMLDVVDDADQRKLMARSATGQTIILA